MSGDGLQELVLAGVVHELRHPLTVIEGQRTLLGDELFGPVTPEMRRALDTIGRQTHKITRILAELEGADVDSFAAADAALFDFAAVVRSALLERGRTPGELPPTWLLGHEASCRRLVDEVLSFVPEEATVVLQHAGPREVVLALRSGGRLDELGGDVLWYSRVVARRHGGRVTSSTHAGAAELRVRLATRVTPGKGRQG